jgi:hypothetical protein
MTSLQNDIIGIWYNEKSGMTIQFQQNGKGVSAAGKSLLHGIEFIYKWVSSNQIQLEMQGMSFQYTITHNIDVLTIEDEHGVRLHQRVA